MDTPYCAQPTQNPKHKFPTLDISLTVIDNLKTCPYHETAAGSQVLMRKPHLTPSRPPAPPPLPRAVP